MNEELQLKIQFGSVKVERVLKEFIMPLSCIVWDSHKRTGMVAIPFEKLHEGNQAKSNPPLPFSWTHIISDKIFGDYPLSSFTFEIYLCRSWIRSTADGGFAKESVEIAAGNMGIQVRGELNTSLKIEIFQTKKKLHKILYFPISQRTGSGIKMILRFFWGNLVVCKIWSLSDTPFSFLPKKCLIFGTYGRRIFFLQYMNSCSPVTTGIIRFGSKLSNNKVFTLKNFWTSDAMDSHIVDWPVKVDSIEKLKGSLKVNISSNVIVWVGWWHNWKLVWFVFHSTKNY